MLRFGDPVQRIVCVDVSCWELQESTFQTPNERFADNKRNGDECAHRLIGGTVTYTETYVCKKPSGNLVLPALGSDGVLGIHVDNLTVEYRQNGAAVMKIAAHDHDGAAHDATRTFTATVTLPARVLGVPSNVVGVSVGAVGIRSLSYSIACTHFDEFGTDAQQISSQSCDAVETLSFQLTDSVAIDPVLFTAAGFEPQTRDQGEKNTVFRSRAFVFQKHLA